MTGRPSSLKTQAARASIKSPRARFWLQAALFASAHYLILLGIGGLIFLVSHTPPKAVNLDPLIEFLVSLENILVAPRKLILRVWPSESTPGGLGMALTILNSAGWGIAMAASRQLWSRLKR